MIHSNSLPLAPSVMLNVGAATCSTVASIATGIYTSTIITNANH